MEWLIGKKLLKKEYVNEDVINQSLTLREFYIVKNPKMYLYNIILLICKVKYEKK